ncbi:MAG TPA: sulfite exporter TauE/SafE family protein [Spongiibacteraceae bacterium]|nr:sulfite exporter TauE/SafE family protein [Spongiibacteraceae bacterium]
MIVDASIILPAFLLGFMGSAHCLGMCGGISAALGAANERHVFVLSLGYNLGRVLSYTLLGALVGTLAQGLSQPILQWLPQGARWLRTLAGLMVIAMGFYVAGWWRGLAQLERLGSYVWRYIQPLTKPLLPPKSLGAALLLGELWGFLPCGLVYSSLTWAALGADALRGAVWMAAFGLGTLPAMFATTHGGSYLQNWTRRPTLRYAAALVLIGAGIVAAVMPWQHAQHDHGNHADPMQHQEHSSHFHANSSDIWKALDCDTDTA